MESSNTPVEAPATKKNNLPIIIGVAVAVILCCCCLLAVGGYAYSRYAAAKALSGINSQIPSGSSVPGGSSAPSGSSGSTAGTVPTGGLGDEITRTTAWGYALAAIVQKDPTSCQMPDAGSTTIDVTQKPDSSGAWQERWNVACGGSVTIPVDISFTPAGGGLFNVKATVAK